MNWKAAEQQFPGKSSQQIFERWTKVLDPSVHKGSWTRHEDETIIRFVQANGCKSWTQLAKLLCGRIGKQCRERWLNHLDPSISRCPWTPEEDKQLMMLHDQCGNRWSQIAALIPNRTDNMIKNRWYSTLAKKTSHEKCRTSPHLLPDPTPTSLGLISPMVPSASPFALMSPLAKIAPHFGPWGGAERAPFASPPSLLENRAELVNLMINQ
jgi:hypothetical protein